jgi:hypothetical protein
MCAVSHAQAEFDFISMALVVGLPPNTTSNTWFGLTIRTDLTGAIPGFNTDGSRMSFLPAVFEYDRARSAVRYYMFACTGGPPGVAGSCGWSYSPGGASDVQPAYLCKFP